MMHNPFNVLLDSVHSYFVEDFAPIFNCDTGLLFYLFALALGGLRGCWGRGSHLGTRRSLGAFGCWEQVPAQLGEEGTTEGTRGFIMILIHISPMISDVDRLFM